MVESRVLVGRLYLFAYPDVPVEKLMSNGPVFLRVVMTKLEHCAVASNVVFFCQFERNTKKI